MGRLGSFRVALLQGMISICIPIFNFDIRPLVNELSRQAASLPVPVEIILLDDASDPAYREQNRLAGANRYIQLDPNQGRSRIRNLFQQYTRYEYLLFLDCDSQVIDSRFLQKYHEAISSSSGIICGGRVYPSEIPERSLRLVWEYGRQRESRPVSQRMAEPNRSFMSNNFLVSKAIFSNISFDERLIGYGHEDTLFGYQLAKAGIVVMHIENPVLNGRLESNAVFLQKTREAIRNLVQIKYFLNDPAFDRQVKLLKTYDRLRVKISFPLMAFGIKMLQPLARFLLSRVIFDLRLFDLYKLGCLIDEMRAQIRKQP